MSYQELVDEIVSSIDRPHDGILEIRDFCALFGYFGRNMEESLGRDRSEVLGLFLNGFRGECPECRHALKSGEIKSVGSAQASRAMPMQGISIDVGDKNLESFVDGCCPQCRGITFRVFWQP